MFLIYLVKIIFLVELFASVLYLYRFLFILGSGIGRAVCSLFAKEGATIIAADINESAAKETIQGIAGETK